LSTENNVGGGKEGKDEFLSPEKRKVQFRVFRSQRRKQWKKRRGGITFPSGGGGEKPQFFRDPYLEDVKEGRERVFPILKKEGKKKTPHINFEIGLWEGGERGGHSLSCRGEKRRKEKKRSFTPIAKEGEG